jgi:hypothetical protein
MKIFNYSLVLIVCLALCGLANGKVNHRDNSVDSTSSETIINDSIVAPIKLLRINANVDGSGRMVFTSGGAHYEHRQWQPPTDVSLNGQAWDKLDQTPAGWKHFCKGLDLSHAWIVKREGRDVIALEPTTKGFDLYLCDTPNGSADYSVTIAIPETPQKD